MHKKLHDSILLLSRRCKYIIKPTNTLSKLSSTNGTIYAKSLPDSSTLLYLIVTVVDFTRFRFRRCGFLPSPGVNGTDKVPSVDVDARAAASLKQA